jgi:acyl-CoA dehydrogenase
MSELLEPFERMLAAVSGRDVEGAVRWRAVEDSGYLDALVPEMAGGAGLSLADVEPLIRALGRYAIIEPVAQTMAVRALLVEQDSVAPSGALTLAQALPETSKSRALGAVLAAAEIAGLAETVLKMSLSYANDRVQFGKPIGKLQAIQQQLAVMGEHVLMTRMAAQIGCSQGLRPTREIAAVAKYAASAAVPQIAAIAHAVHGAIGITEEYDLHLYSRRMHELRLADGSESYWAAELGATRLRANGQSSVDFIRALRRP